MLTPKEKNIIKKYELYSELIRPSMLLAFISPFVWLVLIMIRDLGFHYDADNANIGIQNMLIITGFYVLLFGYTTLSLVFGMRGKKWRAIVEKLSAEQTQSDYSGQAALALGTRAAGNLLQRTGNKTIENVGKGMEVASAIQTMHVVNEISKDAKANVRNVSKAENKSIGAKIVKRLIMWVPITLMIVSFIPTYVNASKAKEASIEVTVASLEKLKNSFDKGFRHVRTDNPYEHFDNDGYNITGNVYDYESENDSYITVLIDKHGVIKEVRYVFHISTEINKEENIKKIKNEMQHMHKYLVNARVVAKSDCLLETSSISEQFEKCFVENEAYEYIRTEDELGDEYVLDSSYHINEKYGDSYVYVSIKEN